MFLTFLAFFFAVNVRLIEKNLGRSGLCVSYGFQEIKHGLIEITQSITRRRVDVLCSFYLST